MAIPARTPAQYHYREAERLLAAAESSPTLDGIAATMALIAIGHAVLADVGPRKLRRRETAPTPPPPSGGSPRERWLRGDDR
jgi:phytoene/squalene synthetase